MTDEIRAQVKGGRVKDAADIKRALKTAIVRLLTDRGGDTSLRLAPESRQGPTVWMVVGVNGGGKTTTIGKLAYQCTAVQGGNVRLVPGDTFRAAAAEQLQTWADRAG